MVLKVKSSTLFFYPVINITVQLKYTSNFKIKQLSNERVVLDTDNQAQKGRAKASKALKSLPKPYKFERIRSMKTDQEKIVLGNCFIYSILNVFSNSSVGQKLEHAGRRNISGALKFTVNNVRMFLKKSKFTRFTILRAPYRYKKGRYQVGFKRYESSLSFALAVSGLGKQKTSKQGPVDTLMSLGTLSKLLESVALFLEIGNTNVMNLNKARLTARYKDPSFFLIKLFN